MNHLIMTLILPYLCKLSYASFAKTCKDCHEIVRQCLPNRKAFENFCKENKLCFSNFNRKCFVFKDRVVHLCNKCQYYYLFDKYQANSILMQAKDGFLVKKVVVKRTRKRLQNACIPFQDIFGNRVQEKYYWKSEVYEYQKKLQERVP